MSATNTISIRLTVEGDAASISKITNVMNGFKGLKGGIEDARSAMQKQWSTGSLSGLGAAIGQTQTQVSTLKTRLTEIGSTLASNAAAFGVATASVWGVYNAYDSLVKVEIRAETAMNRVSTMTTTLATLENRLAEARTKGNLSAEEMAILEDRITDTKAKLATAQERSADLQGDVNEAYGAFASQVGPQVVAAGGSIVQLYTNMRGSLTGIVPRIKDFVSNLLSGGGAAKTMAAGVSPLSNALGELPTKANAAAKGIGALSGAMKGLLLGGGIAVGIFAIGTAIAYFRDQELKAMVSSKELTDAVAKSDEAFATFEETSARAQKTLDLVVKGFGSGFQDLIDKARTLNLENTFNAAVGSIAQSKKAIVDLNPVINGLKEKYMEVTKNASFFDIISGKLADSQKILTDEITRLTDIQNKQGENIKTNTALTERLRAAIALKSGVENKDLEFVLQAIAAGLDKKEAYELLNIVTEKGTKSLNDNTVAVRGNTVITNEAANSATNWITAKKEEVIANAAFKEELIAGAKELGINMDLQGKSIEQIQELILVKLGLKDATDASTKSQEDYNKALNDAQVKADALDQEYRDMQNQLDVVNRTFGTSFDTTHVYGEQLSFLTDLAHEQNFAFIEQEQSLAQLAQQYGVLTTEMVNMTQNMVDDTTQMKEAIASSIDYTAALTDQETNLALVADGHLAAATNVTEFMNSLVTSNAETERTNALLTAVATDVFGAQLPAGIANTNENLQLFIQYLSGSTDAAEKWGQLVSEQFSQVNDAWMEIINSINQDGLNKAWRNLDLSAVPDAFKKAAKKTAEIVADLFDTEGKEKGLFSELETSLALFFATPGAESKKGARKWMNKIIEEMSDELGKSEELDALFKPIVDWLNAIPEEDRIAALTALSMVLPEIKTAAGDVIPNGEQVNAIIAKLNEAAGLASDSVDTLATSYSGLQKAQSDYVASQKFTSTEEGYESLSKGGIITIPGTEPGATTPIPDAAAVEAATKRINVALQSTQTAFANLAQQGSLSLAMLAKASSGNAQGINNNLNVIVSAAGTTALSLAQMMALGIKALSLLASSSSKNMSGMRNNLNIGYVAAGHLQTGLANLANQGARSLTALANSSSKNMNGFVNNLKKGEQAVRSLQSAINSLKGKTVHIGLTGPGVKFLAHGYHGIVDKPTLMVVGEAGAEKVDVSPITGGKATGLQFENTRNVKVEPVGKLDTGPRFERETVHEQTGPRVIQLVTYTYLFPGSSEYRKSVQQVSLDNTGMFPSV